MSDIIRNGVNYGRLIINELEGVQFATDAFYSSMLSLPVLGTTEIPDFNMHMHISTIFPTSHRETVHHVFGNAGVRKLAEALSRHTSNLVRVCSHARILASYQDGQLIGEIRSLDSFYSNVTPEETAATTF